VTVAVRNTNVKDLLEDAIRADPPYEWHLTDGRIIDIYPRNKNERFLDVLVPRFKIQDKTRSVALYELTQTPAFGRMLTNLNAKLRTPISGPGNFSELGPKISIELQNTSLREILNTIVIASHGSAWSAVRYGDHLQYLSLGVGG
jgi:hypothetical protein